MTPLVIVPARMMSEGRPGKNRKAWAALTKCLTALPSAWPTVVLTDDPHLPLGSFDRAVVFWRSMGAGHTIAQCLTIAGEAFEPHEYECVVVLQPSSPSRNRPSYVLSAVRHLEQHPDHSAVVSVTPWIGEPPSKACTLGADGILEIPPTPEARQAQPRHYRRDGTVYAVRAQYARQGDLYGPTPIPLLIDPADSVTLD